MSSWRSAPLCPSINLAPSPSGWTHRDAVPTGELRLHVNQRDVGVFTGTGRSNVVSLPCSEDAYARLVGPQRGALMRGRAIKHVIHWFSPLPPARTDIAEYTRRILPALNREAQVILWTDQGVWGPGSRGLCRGPDLRSGHLLSREHH